MAHDRPINCPNCQAVVPRGHAVCSLCGGPLVTLPPAPPPVVRERQWFSVEPATPVVSSAPAAESPAAGVSTRVALVVAGLVSVAIVVAAWLAYPREVVVGGEGASRDESANPASGGSAAPSR